MKKFTQAINEWSLSDKAIEKIVQDGYDNSIDIKLLNKLHNKVLFEPLFREVYSCNIHLYVKEFLKVVEHGRDLMEPIIQNMQKISAKKGKYVKVTLDEVVPYYISDFIRMAYNEKVMNWNDQYELDCDRVKTALEYAIEVDEFCYNNFHDYETLYCDERSEKFYANVKERFNDSILDANSSPYNRTFFEMDFIGNAMVRDYKNDVDNIKGKSLKNFDLDIYENDLATKIYFLKKI